MKTKDFYLEWWTQRAGRTVRGCTPTRSGREPQSKKLSAAGFRGSGSDGRRGLRVSVFLALWGRGHHWWSLGLPRERGSKARPALCPSSTTMLGIKEKETHYLFLSPQYKTTQYIIRITIHVLNTKKMEAVIKCQPFCAEGKGMELCLHVGKALFLGGQYGYWCDLYPYSSFLRHAL